MPQQKSIAIVSDDQALTADLQRVCASLGLTANCHSTAGAALIANLDAPADLMLLDANADCGGGLTMLGLLVGYDQFSAAPAILLADEEDAQLVRRCHSMFAYHLIKSDNLIQRIRPLLRELVDLAPVPDDALPGFAPEIIPDQNLEPTPEVRGADTRRDGLPNTAKTVGKPPEKSPAIAKRGSLPATKPGKVDLTIGQAIEYLASQPAMIGDTTAGGRPPVNEASTSDTPPCLLLILRDSRESAELRELLESYGVAVVRALDGEDGIRLALSQPVMAVVLDATATDNDARYLMSRLRNNPITRSLPVVVRTDEFDRAMERTLMHWGANDVVPRRGGEKLLVEMLRTHIDLLPESLERHSLLV